MDGEPLLIDPAEVFDLEKLYYVGVCRRSPFNPLHMPQCLNGASAEAALGPFDASAGSLWRVVPSPAIPNGIALMCADAGPERFLAADLSMTADMASAALLRVERAEPFRGTPGAVCARLILTPAELVLCASVEKQTVHALDHAEAQQRVPPAASLREEERFVFADTWEFSPEAAEDDFNKDEFLSRFASYTV